MAGEKMWVMTRRKGPGRVLIWLLVLKVGYLLAVYLAVRSRPALDRGSSTASISTGPGRAVPCLPRTSPPGTRPTDL